MGFAPRHKWLKRVSKGSPLGGLLLAGELALLTGRHVGKLDAAQRRRLVVLMRRGAELHGALSAAERRELGGLLARLEPRLFVGSAVRQLSPVPMPKRLLYGRRSNAKQTD